MVPESMVKGELSKRSGGGDLFWATNQVGHPYKSVSDPAAIVSVVFLLERRQSMRDSPWVMPETLLSGSQALRKDTSCNTFPGKRYILS